MRWCRELFCFSEAETAKVEAERGLFNGLITQVATEDPSDEGGREVVKFFKQLLAEVATMSSKKMRHFGRSGTKSAEEQFDSCILDIGQVLAQCLQFAKACGKELSRSF